jgi:glycerol-3-phosphate acyltransferase PlsY
MPKMAKRRQTTARDMRGVSRGLRAWSGSQASIGSHAVSLPLAIAFALPHLGAGGAAGLVASYLLGAIPFGFVLVRLVKGVDLRTVGSGNIGATNAMRVLGKPLGIVAFLLDFAKGLVPVVVFAPLFAPQLDGAASLPIRVLFGAAAVVGHVFPIYLRFKGGKAVATGCGALIGLDPLVFVAGGLAWLVAVGTTRMVSVGSLAMALAFALAAWWRSTSHTDGGWLVAGACALAALIVWRHRSNIARIVAGTEPRIGAKKAAAAAGARHEA